MINSKIKVGLVQINNTFSGQTYIPYTAGSLQAYFQETSENSENFNFENIIYRADTIDKIVKKLSRCNIIGASLYQWNYNFTLEICKQLKQKTPLCKIIVGGPQIKDLDKSLLENNPFIDIAVYGEGEEKFSAILNHLHSGEDLNIIPGIIYRKGQAVYATNPTYINAGKLENYPSPYLSGCFDNILKEDPNLIGMIETNRGCPYKCAYCNWGGHSFKTIRHFTRDRVYGELNWLAQNKFEFVIFCDGNFGLFKKDLDTVNKLVELKQTYGYPKVAAIQNSKKLTTNLLNIHDALNKHGLDRGVTISIQTTSQEALKNVKRSNLTLDDFLKFQSKLARLGIQTYTDFIIGLPGETYKSFIEGIDIIINKGQYNKIQFNNLVTVPNTEMDTPEYKEKYKLISVKTKPINRYGTLYDDLYEEQESIVGSYSFTVEDFIKMKVFSHMTSFLIFNKFLQIPILLMHKLENISYKDIIHKFISAESNCNTIRTLIKLFTNHATNLTKGGFDYAYSKEYHDIYWPLEELAYINLVANNQLSTTYQEAGQLLLSMVSNKNKSVITEAIELNKQLLVLPTNTVTKLSLTYNIYENYLNILKNQPINIEKTYPTYEIEIKYKFNNVCDWCRDIIWYKNKPGNYLYQCIKK